MYSVCADDRIVRDDSEMKSLNYLYKTKSGNLLLRIISRRSISKAIGKYLDSRFSKPLCKRFIRKNHINIEDFENNNFKCFNDCFTRKIKSDLRPVDKSPQSIVSPCDSYLSFYKISENTCVPIKGTSYTLASLFRDNNTIPEKYKNGTMLIFRLCVNHYHRYCYCESGKIIQSKYIKGRLHTVQSIAFEKHDVYSENCREYMEISTGKADYIQMEVGALLVGKIKNHDAESVGKEVKRGDEKGMFLYGGSTVVLVFPDGSAEFPEKCFENTQKGNEYSVKYGEPVGKWLI